jgi:hypothetical protein
VSEEVCVCVCVCCGVRISIETKIARQRTNELERVAAFAAAGGAIRLHL